VFAVVALVVFGSGAAVVVASRGSDKATIANATTVNVDCPAPSLSGSLPALVSLPAGYGRRSTGYPVVYFPTSIVTPRPRRRTWPAWG
jgi:hypothetical protein